MQNQEQHTLDWVNAVDNKVLDLFVERFWGEPTLEQLSGGVWFKIEDEMGGDIYRELLTLVAGRRFNTEEAHKHWKGILSHWREMNRKLGRAVRFQVAVCDYLMHIDHNSSDLVLINLDNLLNKERSALVDELTSLYNRRFFNVALAKEIENNNRYDQPFSLLMIDVDDFKKFNDQYGHADGDAVLAGLAEVLQSQTRVIDYAIRYGGEEFVIIMPHCEKNSALIVAERIRQAFERKDFGSGRRLTLTIGVASCPEDALDGLSLLQRADESLYIGKNNGKNRVTPYRAERRRDIRYPLAVEMMFLEWNEVRQEFMEGQTRNLSMGGMLCQVDQPVEVGEKLNVMLFPSDRRISALLDAEVLKTRKNGGNTYYLNMSFDLNEHSKSELQKLFANEGITT